MKDQIFELIKNTVTTVPDDVRWALIAAYNAQENKAARFQLENIIENIRIAQRDKIPLCQDTGLPVFYLRAGGDVKDCNRAFNKFRDAVESAVEKAALEGFLRPNVVDVISRENKGSRGKGIPIINFEFAENLIGAEIIYMPKGSGSENMSALKMLTPSDGIEGAVSFAVDAVKSAGGKPCPPTIIGIGLGGSFDVCASLSKKALLRPINIRNPNPQVAALEVEILEKINDLNIGPMGLGGSSTSLGVNIEIMDTHTAMLPVAISIQCWAARSGILKLPANFFD